LLRGDTAGLTSTVEILPAEGVDVAALDVVWEDILESRTDNLLHHLLHYPVGNDTDHAEFVDDFAY
jgi:hypothetical protein